MSMSQRKRPRDAADDSPHDNNAEDGPKIVDPIFMNYLKTHGAFKTAAASLKAEDPTMADGLNKLSESCEEFGFKDEESKKLTKLEEEEQSLLELIKNSHKSYEEILEKIKKIKYCDDSKLAQSLTQRLGRCEVKCTTNKKDKTISISINPAVSEGIIRSLFEGIEGRSEGLFAAVPRTHYFIKVTNGHVEDIAFRLRYRKSVMDIPIPLQDANIGECRI